MENASKALLIAAAVLVVILIIAFGMTIINSSTGTADQATSSIASTEVQAFNSQFTAYNGKQKGSAVRNLIVAIMQSNSKSVHQIDITGVPALTSIDDSKIYTVGFGYATDGYINLCTAQ